MQFFRWTLKSNNFAHFRYTNDGNIISIPYLFDIGRRGFINNIDYRISSAMRPLNHFLRRAPTSSWLLQFARDGNIKHPVS